MKSGKLAELRSVLANRPFAIYTTCNSISMVGVWMQRLAVGWLTWQLTESEFWIGAIAFADLLPVVLVGPLAGVWVDRPLRRMLIKWCQSVMLLQSLLLYVLTANAWINIGWLFLLVLVNGIVAAIYHPVRLSVVPSLVGARYVASAISITAVTFHLTRFAGPALAGMIIAWQGIPVTFLAVALSYSVMLAAVFFLRIPPRPWLESRPGQSVLAGLREGASYTLDNRPIAYVLFLQAVLAVCARPVGELLPAFVGSVFAGGAEMLAVLTSAMGIGAVAAGLRMLLWEARGGMVNLAISSTVTSGASVILFTLTGNIWVAAILILLVGYWVTVCGIVSQTLIQISVDPAMRGRVVSLWAAIYRGAPGVGALVIGWLAGIYGLVGPNIAAAALCVLAALGMLAKRPLMQAFFVHPGHRE